MNTYFGYSQTDITPDSSMNIPGIHMWGFREGIRYGYSDYIDINNISKNSIGANAIHLNNNHNSILLLTLDLGMMTSAQVDIIRQGISKQTGLSIESISVNVSHTHGAPSMDTAYNGKFGGVFTAVDEYVNQVLMRAIECGVRAYNNTDTPVEMYYNNGTTAIAHHRRDSQDFHQPHLDVISLRNSMKKVVGIIANTPCHPVVVRDNISSDFVGLFRAKMKQYYPQAASIFMQGFSATSNPAPINNTGYNKENFHQFAQSMADILAGDVHKLVGNIQGSEVSDVHIDSNQSSIDIPVSSFDIGLLEQHPEKNNAPIQQFLEDFYENGGNKITTSMDCTIQHHLLGRDYQGQPVSIFTSSHELTGDMRTKVQQIIPGKCMTAGYTNGVSCYLVPNKENTGSSLPYEAYMSNLWYGNYGVPSDNWEQIYLNHISDICKHSQ